MEIKARKESTKKRQGKDTARMERKRPKRAAHPNDQKRAHFEGIHPTGYISVVRK